MFILRLLSLCFFIFNILSQSYTDENRPEICEVNMQDCITACWCHDKSNPQVNDCDPDTLNWRCICDSRYIPDTKNTTFKAHRATCEIKYYSCKDKCATDNDCAQKCTTTLQSCVTTDLKDGTCQVRRKELEEKKKKEKKQNETNTEKDSSKTKEKEKSIYDSSSISIFGTTTGIYLASIAFIFAYFS